MRVVDRLKDFCDDWLVGFRLLFALAVLGGFCMACGGIVGALIAVLLAVLAQVALGHSFAESWGIDAAMVGTAIWGVALIGRFKGAFIEVLTDKS